METNSYQSNMKGQPHKDLVLCGPTHWLINEHSSIIPAPSSGYSAWLVFQRGNSLHVGGAI